MAIRRAGPYADSVDSFLNEPTTLSIFIHPVNCAMDASSATWPWKYLAEDNDSALTFEDGFVSESYSDSGSFAFGGSRSWWKYQAAEETSFDLTYDVQANGLDEFDSASISVRVNGASVFSDSSTPSIAGTETITLPASVVPSVVQITASFLAEGLPASTGSLDYSIS